MKHKFTRSEVIAELWRQGQLSFKLDACQRSLYDLFYNGKDKTNVWLLSRRFGKSRTLLVLALETCLRKPKSIVNYVAPTKLQLANIIRPLIDDLLVDCPEQLRPDCVKNQHIYFFKNGSELRLAGSDGGHAEKLRGGDSSAAFIDEAGDVDNLDYIIKSIILPTTLMTKGKIVIAGTPPKKSEHDFIKVIEAAEERQTLIRKTLDDNTRLTEIEKADFIAEMGGRDSIDCRRECYCEIMKDPNTSVVPEFTEALKKEIVKPWIKPNHYDCYESMDLGYSDFTAVLFMYYDFRAAKLIVEDELVMDFSKPGNNIPALIKAIKDKEWEHWKNPYVNEVKKPFLRVSDINPMVTQEIARASNGEITFFNANKSDKEANLHNMRVMLASKKVIINPRCVNLIRHLEHAKWINSNKKDFARSAENGHYDTIPALMYGIRSISFQKNPYPAGYDLPLGDTYIPNKSGYNSGFSNGQISSFKKIFNIRGK